MPLFLPDLNAFTPPKQHVIPFLIGQGCFVCIPDNHDMRSYSDFDYQDAMSNYYVFHCGARPAKNDRMQTLSSQNADSHTAVAQTRPAL